jgi:hypothetical protein
MSGNNFKISQLVSRVASTMIEEHSCFMREAYNQVEMGKVQDYRSTTFDIKISGYPIASRGITSTSTSIDDRFVTYAIDKTNDIYNAAYDVDIFDSAVKVVGGNRAFDASRYTAKNVQNMNDQGKSLIDDYVSPMVRILLAQLDVEMGERLRVAAFRTPYNGPEEVQAITSFSDLTRLKSYMFNYGYQSGKRCVFLNSVDYQNLVNSFQNMYNKDINKQVTNTGNWVDEPMSGFRVYECSTIQPTLESPQYVANNDSTGVTVGALSADGYQLTLAGVISTTGLVFNAGTRITLSDVTFINQVSKISHNDKVTVTVAQDADGDGAGNVTVILSEPLLAVGVNAYTDSLPAIGAPVTVWGAHRNNYAKVPMGIITNPVPLDDIATAEHSKIYSKTSKALVQMYSQGVVVNGVNTHRASICQPMYAMAYNLFALPTPLT